MLTDYLLSLTGPVAWIVTSEVFPLSMRAKGVSIGGSSNWVCSSSIQCRSIIF
jgi:hypothetical protein